MSESQLVVERLCEHGYILCPESVIKDFQLRRCSGGIRRKLDPNLWLFATSDSEDVTVQSVLDVTRADA